MPRSDANAKSITKSIAKPITKSITKPIAKPIAEPDTVLFHQCRARQLRGFSQCLFAI